MCSTICFSNNVVAVFGIDQSLIFHQPFTRDADALRAAITDRLLLRISSGSPSSGKRAH